MRHGHSGKPGNSGNSGHSSLSLFIKHKTFNIKLNYHLETTRQNKIARLIQKDLSNIFQAQTRQTRGILVSVSVVRISPDLSVAKAYLSIFPSAKAQEILQNINDHASAIRYEMGKLQRHQLRIIPELKFFLDDSLDYLENIDKLLNEDKEKKAGNTEQPENTESEQPENPDTEK